MLCACELRAGKVHYNYSFLCNIKYTYSLFINYDYANHAMNKKCQKIMSKIDIFGFNKNSLMEKACNYNNSVYCFLKKSCVYFIH